MDQEKKLRLRIKDDNIEISVEGTKEDLLSKIDEMVELYEETRERLLLSPSFKRRPKIPVEKEELPIIPYTNSPTEAVRSLFSRPWGSKPRSAREVNKVLKETGLPFNDRSIRSTLSRLLAAGEIRRIRQGGVYRYLSIV